MPPQYETHQRHTLRDLVQSTLERNPHLARRRLRVDQTDDRLVLSGNVDSFYHKQVAQESIRAASGGLRIVNDLTVAD
ncbi:BON domain-containing protein [Stratiformator vulcanicus]|uniref:BON domain protein n=1 Tax=Stratiformator vulcanicus TaxID=2527980 RepID=A0A517QXR6_9PLAN|nr:BON domain-containing protein [Stratiformator vulcanicus]QDT36397.1 BON domain protein [Stratiformator vulcanicus]